MVRLINKRISLVRLQILTTSHLRTLDRVYISINSGSDLAPHSLINKRCFSSHNHNHQLDHHGIHISLHPERLNCARVDHYGSLYVHNHATI